MQASRLPWAAGDALRKLRIGCWLLWLLAAGSGCNQNPYLTPNSPAWQSSQPQLSQLQDLGQRATALDADNRDLHAELAKAMQQNEVLVDEVDLLRRQLADKATELRELLAAKKESDHQMETLTASTRFRGGATITANNSLQVELPRASLPGLEVRRDQDLIRVELPADRLFHQGTHQLLPTAGRLLDQVADLITQTYPRQTIGIEGHSDSLPHGNGSRHQLASARAVAVFEALTRHNQLPEHQLFTVSYGANRPLVSNATPAGRARNRRIEVVIYPETAEDG